MNFSQFFMFIQIPLVIGQFNGQDLSSQIFQHVNSQLRNNFRNQPFSAFGHSSFPFGVEDSISQFAKRRLQPLEGLGDRIRNQVQQSLLPVSALTIKNKMKNGIGGSTVIKYDGYPTKTFITKQGIRYTCDGNIEGSQCYGSLKPFSFKTKEDFCYTLSYASTKNKICLSSGPLNVEIHNDNINCRSSSGQSILLNESQYQELCGQKVPKQISYTYYADSSNSEAISIPNKNPYVKCKNNTPGVCTFDVEAPTVGKNSVVSSGNAASSVYSSYIQQ